MKNQESWQFQGPLKLLKQRAFLLAKIREFFVGKNVLEVSTPLLSTAGNTDVQIEMFQTQSIKPEAEKAFLRTSPEFFHKRLLASGSGDIFEIAPVFRAGELTPLHNPEFTLLEWYRLDFLLVDLMDEVIALIKQLNDLMGVAELDVEMISYESMFQEYAQINPFQIDLGELRRRCEHGGYVGSNLSRTEALDFLFALVIQPQLVSQNGRIKGVMVYHFPIEMAALAQAHPEHPEQCLRFEFLWNGVELANGYQELTDAKEQRRRFEQDNQIRAEKDHIELPIDEHLLSALSHGLPVCSGVALGVERLMMCLLGQESIQDVMGFYAENS